LDLLKEKRNNTRTKIIIDLVVYEFM